MISRLPNQNCDKLNTVASAKSHIREIIKFAIFLLWLLWYHYILNINICDKKHYFCCVFCGAPTHETVVITNTIGQMFALAGIRCKDLHFFNKKRIRALKIVRYNQNFVLSGFGVNRVSCSWYLDTNNVLNHNIMTLLKKMNYLQISVYYSSYLCTYGHYCT